MHCDFILSLFFVFWDCVFFPLFGCWRHTLIAIMMIISRKPEGPIATGNQQQRCRARFSPTLCHRCSMLLTAFFPLPQAEKQIRGLALLACLCRKFLFLVNQPLTCTKISCDRNVSLLDKVLSRLLARLSDSFTVAYVTAPRAFHKSRRAVNMFLFCSGDSGVCLGIHHLDFLFNCPFLKRDAQCILLL